MLSNILNVSYFIIFWRSSVSGFSPCHSLTHSLKFKPSHTHRLTHLYFIPIGWRIPFWILFRHVLIERSGTLWMVLVFQHGTIQSYIKYDHVKVTGAFLPRLIGVWPRYFSSFLTKEKYWNNCWGLVQARPLFKSVPKLFYSDIFFLK